MAELDCFASALRSARLNASLGMVEAAAAVGVTRSSLSRWETGTREPERLVLGRLLSLYGLNAEAQAVVMGLPRHVVVPPGDDTSPPGETRQSPVITWSSRVPESSADDEPTAPTTDPPVSGVLLSGVCHACSGRGQVAGGDCDACDCTGRVLLISGDEAVDAA